jgi:biotin carboxyl carrier protein
MKSLEIKLNDRIAAIELESRVENHFHLSVDGRKYEADIIQVERGVYLVIMGGKSYNVELIENGDPKKYHINTLYHQYDAEVIDAETRYMKGRKVDHGLEDTVISSPMPGKVVKILVKAGDKVKAGETVVIVSAMKMESEYKVKKDRLIKEIKVKEGDTVNANQPLIIIE